MAYVVNAGVRVYYEVRGEGPAVLLHCGGADDLGSWVDAGYIHGLEGFECVLIDPRGHGHSDKPLGLEEHRIERYVDDVVAIIDGLRLPRVAFWGMSDGAVVGFALTARHPERVAGLIAHEGRPGPESADDYAGRVKAAGEIRVRGLDEFLDEFERREGVAYPDWMRSRLHRADGEMLALELEAWAGWKGVWDSLPNFRTPTLILVREANIGWAERAAALIPSAAVATLPGGHIGTFLRSDLALAHARPFLFRLEFGNS